ncbi:glycoside hydrolase [Chloroflexi bacterium TSY]|nr:glycoside hydrolase [Chloroflexi bacterium TSY]
MTKILAQDYQILTQSSDPENNYTGSPCLAQLPSGRLASYEWFQPQPYTETIPNQLEILVSDDVGASWRKTAALDIIWPSLFVVDQTLYCIGNRRQSREIIISRSEDEGESWTDPAVLFEGRYHNAPTHILFKNGFVYRAFETCPPGDDAVGRSQWKSLVIAGDLSQDLLTSAAWRMSNHVGFPGVPDVLSQRRYAASAADKVVEDCFIEGNVIDVRGEMRMLLRTIIDGHTTGGMTAVCQLDDDGETMYYRFVQFYPMPGAQCKFHIVYDEVSDLFWTTVTLPTNTWQPREPLRRLGFASPPGNERRILMLMYSLDALNWFQAGCVAMSTSIFEAFSYASQLIVGEELLVISRTSQGGKNQHDTNLVTLHRIKDFRQLALELKPTEHLQ